MIHRRFNISFSELIRSSRRWNRNRLQAHAMRVYESWSHGIARQERCRGKCPSGGLAVGEILEIGADHESQTRTHF